MKHTFKRVLVGFLATAMALTAVPFTSFAAPTTEAVTLTYAGASAKPADFEIKAVANCNVADSSSDAKDVVTVTDNTKAASFTITVANGKAIAEVTSTDTTIGFGSTIDDSSVLVTLSPNASAARTPTINFKLVDAVVWINGKDVKTSYESDKTTVKVQGDLNKTAAIEVEGMYKGGIWTPLVTAATVTESALVATKDEVVAGNYFDNKGKILKAVSDATKNTVIAKCSKGKLTITAGKALVDNTKTVEYYKVWITEVGTDKAVVNTETVNPWSYDIAVKVAPTNAFISTVNNATAEKKVVAADKNAFVAVGSSKTFYFNPIGFVTDSKAKTYSAVSGDTNFVAEVKKEAERAYVDVTPIPGGFIVTGKAVNSGKVATATVTVTNLQSRKAISFKVSVVNPVKTLSITAADSKVIPTFASAKTEVVNQDVEFTYTTFESTATAYTDTVVAFVATVAPTGDDYSKIFTKLEPGKVSFNSESKVTNGISVKYTKGQSKVVVSAKKGTAPASEAYLYIVAYNKFSTPVVQYAKVTFGAPNTAVKTGTITITKPVIGGTPATTANTSDTSYEAGTIKWTGVAGDKYAANDVPVATFTITAKIGYEFDSTLAITITDATVTVEIDDDKATAVVTATFAKLA